MNTRRTGLVVLLSALLAFLPVVTSAQSLVGVQANIVVNAGLTAYLSPLGQVKIVGGSSLLSNLESAVQVPFAYGATATNLTVWLKQTTPAGGNVSLTVRVNGVDSALAVVFPPFTPAGVYADSSNAVAITPGDLVSLRLTNGSSGQAFFGGISFEYGP